MPNKLPWYTVHMPAYSSLQSLLTLSTIPVFHFIILLKRVAAHVPKFSWIRASAILLIWCLPRNAQFVSFLQPLNIFLQLHPWIFQGELRTGTFQERFFVFFCQWIFLHFIQASFFHAHQKLFWAPGHLVLSPLTVLDSNQIKHNFKFYTKYYSNKKYYPTLPSESSIIPISYLLYWQHHLQCLLAYNDQMPALFRGHACSILCIQTPWI